MTQRTNRELMLGVLTGATLGAALGVLFSPHKGSVTRKIIKNRLEEGKEMAGEKMDEAKHMMGK